MTQEERQLLLKDLAARVPYGLKGKCEFETETDTEFWSETNRFNLDVNLEKISKYGKIRVRCFFDDTIDKESEEGVKQLNLLDFVEDYQDYADDEIDIEDFKPYLRPINSITNDELKELLNRVKQVGVAWNDKLNIKIDDVNGLSVSGCERGECIPMQIISTIMNFCYEKHLDCNDLIKKRLALQSPKGMYNKTNNKNE